MLLLLDILPNPGPRSAPTKITSILKIGGNFKRSFSSTDLNNYSTRTIVYSKSELFKLKAKYTISRDLYSILKDQKLLRARGICSGLSARNKICTKRRNKKKGGGGGWPTSFESYIIKLTPLMPHSRCLVHGPCFELFDISPYFKQINRVFIWNM